jgi:glyceraldehyde-3-phosphate dehydrogenase (NAD(P))
MSELPKIRVAVNGYGVIGKRVAAAVTRQSDMELAGIGDVTADWRLRDAARRGFALYGATAAHSEAMLRAHFNPAGVLQDLVGAADVVVDCTPKHVGAANAELYRRAGKPFIVQGGEKHDVTGHSFVAETSYAAALSRPATRVVSCNTTSIVRTLSALKRAEIPSHQGPDARSVDPDLDVVTMAVKVPETLGHLHYWSVQLLRPSERAEVLDAFATSTRIAPISTRDGLSALNVVKEMTADLGRPHGDLYEVALWTDMLKVEGDELFYAYMVDNQAIVIPETIDAIRALSGRVHAAEISIAQTNASLGVGALLGVGA